MLSWARTRNAGKKEQNIVGWTWAFVCVEQMPWRLTIHVLLKNYEE